MNETKLYEFRKLNSTDIAPMCKIIGKIGINEFSKCFETEGIMDLIQNNNKKKDVTKVIGLQVLLEISNIIITHIPDCEEDVFELLASVSGLTVDTVKEFDLATFTAMIIDFVRKEEFKDFIGVVSKLFK